MLQSLPLSLSLLTQMKYFSSETENLEKGDMAVVGPKAYVVDFHSSLMQKILIDLLLGMVFRTRTRCYGPYKIEKQAMESTLRKLKI